MAIADKTYQTVKVEREDGIAWVTLNRPEKRNAMSPQLHFEMVDVLTELESDTSTSVLVLTGAGEAWCAGQDLREYFRGLDDKPAERRRASWATQEWRWRRLFTYPKVTIAMVNGYTFGGAFTQLVALYYILTGDTFDGKQAAAMKLVNFAVPRAQLRDETVKLARKLLNKNPHTLRAAKEVFKTARTMDYWQAEEYMAAKATALRATDPENGREKGIRQFLDEKRYRPGLGEYIRGED